MLPNAEIKQIIDLIPGFKTKTKPNDYHKEICYAISTAHQEWIDAQCFFDNVNDNDLIDYAIHKIDAAKSKYMYLLKLARESGIRVDI